jgi:hypothetical protein
MASSNTVEFLKLLDEECLKKIEVSVSSKKSITISPLNFKQQKSLITTGLNGLIGVMQFIKILNDIILENSNERDLKIYDRIPIILALRKNLHDKNIEIDGVDVKIDDLINKFYKFDDNISKSITEDGFTVTLKIPTLVEENKFIANCLQEIKKSDDDAANNASIIISHEIPKFIDSITFGDTVIHLSTLTNDERSRIINALPATTTNKITEFITKIRDYDEKLLTIDDKVLDIDHSFFE